MKLSQLLALSGIDYDVKGSDPEITAIEYDSRKVQRGALFVAIKGFQTDGHDYILKAVSRGASAVICEKPLYHRNLHIIPVHNSRKMLAYLSQAYYNTYTLPFKLTGITGTNGKTTLTGLISYLENKSGLKTASLGTLGFNAQFTIPGISDRTTPESSELHRIFHYCSQQGVESLAMEVSSIALDLFRVENVLFDGAVFTNLSQDHLDFHHTMDAYFFSKAQLFNQLNDEGKAFINTDDVYGNQLYTALNCKKINCSLKNPLSDYYYSDLNLTTQGLNGIIESPDGSIRVSAPLMGQFNAYNLLQAVAVWREYHPETGIDTLDLNDFKIIPGRMEIIRTKSHGTVILDFAHTPDAVEKILKAMSEVPHRKKTVVLGCGGNRDKTKRPDMGRIAEELADRVILTNDNPRYEDPELIIQDMLKGMKRSDSIDIIQNRAEAIGHALLNSDSQDLTFILGKGAETYLEINGEKIPYNDKETVLNWIKKNEN
ncbi:MAG TPA: UDP-N-acetylmuramoyl-L-alanyl-D-glutamate--2,6-diaminopimelate ligase [Candidatus Marinimicrobia bacterium]|nr:UDP-N-acetylmuramoyl-L-alanyl-D-glutamate--2,6-diaminopimelate ligase [Candidatus Neomarinimicrobiota bacterium]